MIKGDTTEILAALVRQAYDRFTDNDMQPPNYELSRWITTAEAALEQARKEPEP